MWRRCIGSFICLFIAVMVACDGTPSVTTVPPTKEVVGTIVGQVSYLGTDAPVANATVQLSDLPNIQTSSGSDGSYVLTDVPLGMHWVVASTPIGSTNPISVLVLANATVTVNLSMTPVAAPTTKPPPTEPPPTASVGSISGRVTVQAPPNPPQPANQAQVGLVDLPGITTTTDSIGSYRLSGVPNGQHFIYAQTKSGMSDVFSVNVSGNQPTQDIQILTLLPIIHLGIAHGRVQTEDARPVAGATVWILGDTARTTSEPDGTFALVNPVPARTASTAFIAVAGDRWGLIPESGGGATPVITLNRRTPAPAPPVVVYDFVAHAAEASWRNGSNALVWNLPDNDSRGFALYRQGMELEDGSRPARFLETHPQWIAGGTIRGTYPQNLTFQKGDYFVARIGFMKGGNAGKAHFYVTFVPAGSGVKIVSSIGDVSKSYTGYLSAFVAGVPDSITGVPGNISLTVDAGDTAAQDWAVWVEAQIVRAK